MKIRIATCIHSSSRMARTLRSNSRLVFTLVVLALTLYSLRTRISKNGADETEIFTIGSKADWPKAMSLLNKLGIVLSAHEIDKVKSDSFDEEPIIVSAFSDNHYHEGITLLGSVQKWIGNRKSMILYDLGLSQYRVDYLKSHYDDVIIDIKKFNFEFLPPGIKKLHECRWKPIIIGLELTNHSSILWLDSSVVIKKSLGPIFHLHKSCRSYCPTYSWLLFSSARHNIKMATNPSVFQYFPLSENLKNRTMYEAGIQLIYATKETKENLLIPWILCSLDDNCISPPDSNIHCRFDLDTYGNYSHCHRFDQSIINVLLARENKLQEKYVALQYCDFFEVRKNDWLAAFWYYLFY